jgi:hypothetical protein
MKGYGHPIMKMAAHKTNNDGEEGTYWAALC